jgi:hypothetical protein
LELSSARRAVPEPVGVCHCGVGLAALAPLSLGPGVSQPQRVLADCPDPRGIHLSQRGKSSVRRLRTREYDGEREASRTL